MAIISYNQWFSSCCRTWKWSNLSLLPSKFIILLYLVSKSAFQIPEKCVITMCLNCPSLTYCYVLKCSNSFKFCTTFKITLSNVCTCIIKTNNCCNYSINFDFEIKSQDLEAYFFISFHWKSLDHQFTFMIQKSWLFAGIITEYWSEFS